LVETIPTETDHTSEPNAATSQHEGHEHHEGHDHAGHEHHDHEHHHDAPATNPECTREISIDIPADVVTKEEDALVEQYRRHAKVPGFRQGKVPATIIRRRYAANLREELVEKLLPRYFQEEAQKQGLSPISRPEISEATVEVGKPWHFKATFEIFPVLEVHDYDRVTVEKPVVTVTDEQFEEEIKRFRENFARHEDVTEDRGLTDGDWAKVSFEGWFKPGEGDAVEPADKPAHTQKERFLEIGGEDLFSLIGNNLRGAKKDETRKFEVTYPSDFRWDKVAGKTLDYTATVNAIQQKIVPEITDEQVQQVSQTSKTVEEFRTEFREHLLKSRQHEAERESKNKLVDILVDRYEFPIPETLVQRQLDTRIERGLRALAYQGMKEEDMRKLDFQRLRAGQRDGAIREVKASLILDSIAETEKIEVSSEELDQELLRLAQSTRETPEALRKRLEENGTLGSIRERIRTEKTIDMLYNKVTAA